MINPLANFKNPYDIDGEIAKKILNQDQILGGTSKFLDYNKQEEELDLDSNTPNKYENIIFGNVTTYKAVKGIKPFTEKDILKDIPVNKNWDVFIMKSLKDALDSLEKLKVQLQKNRFVKTLFLQTHGSPDGLGLKGINISAAPNQRTDYYDEDGIMYYEPIYYDGFEDYLLYKESNLSIDDYIEKNAKDWGVPKKQQLRDNLYYCELLFKITNFIENNGTLIIGGCNAGEIDKEERYAKRNIPQFLIEKIFDYRISVIANRDYTGGITPTLVRRPNEQTVVEKYTFLNKPLTPPKNYKEGWRILKMDKTLDNSKKNLKLLSTGNPYEFID